MNKNKKKLKQNISSIRSAALSLGYSSVAVWLPLLNAQYLRCIRLYPYWERVMIYLLIMHLISKANGYTMAPWHFILHLMRRTISVWLLYI